MNRRHGLGVLVVASALATGVVYRAELGAWLGGDHRAPAPRDDGVAFYTCSMDPSVEADHQGICPICGMALTPVTKEDHASGVVRISARARKQIGLQVAPVETRSLRKRVLASGAVEQATAGRASIAGRVYRGDAGSVQAGQPVLVTAAALPLTQFTGAIVTPAELRVAVDNPDDVLRPGMRVEVEIDVELPPRLVVPAQAVVYAGAKRIVFVDRRNGQFEPRTPRLGTQALGFVEVLDGLAAGDSVVVEGTFLLAAESRIRSDGALWIDTPAPAPQRTAEGSSPP
jgi:hypothetical protein